MIESIKEEFYLVSIRYNGQKWTLQEECKNIYEKCISLKHELHRICLLFQDSLMRDQKKQIDNMRTKHKAEIQVCECLEL